VGVVTDRDIVMRIVVPRLHPCECQVYHAMTPRVVSVHVDAGFCECARAMRANRVRRVVVVDDRGGVIGMVTDGDLARACHGDPELEHELAQVVEEVSACTTDGHQPAAVPVMAGMTAVLDRPNHHE
jgi:CBS domain-containing protein